MTATATAQADTPSGFRLGLIPGFRFGFGFGSAPHRASDGEVSDEPANGYHVEPHLDLVTVFPNDRVGLTLGVGYIWHSLTGVDSIWNHGFAAHPSLDIALSGNWILRLGAGPMVGWTFQPGAEAVFAAGGRVSLELNWVVVSFRSFEMAMGLGVFHSRTMEFDIGPPGDVITTQFASTSIVMTVLVSGSPR